MAELRAATTLHRVGNFACNWHISFVLCTSAALMCSPLHAVSDIFHKCDEGEKNEISYAKLLSSYIGLHNKLLESFLARLVASRLA